MKEGSTQKGNVSPTPTDERPPARNYLADLKTLGWDIHPSGKYATKWNPVTSRGQIIDIFKEDWSDEDDTDLTICDMDKFKKGDRVRCIPGHANGDKNHKDCEDGVVSSAEDHSGRIFVKYDNSTCDMITGDEPYTAQATNKHDLVKLNV